MSTYTETRGSKYENVYYLSDANDSGVTYTEGKSLITLWNHHQTWHFVEIKPYLSESLCRVYIARNSYDEQSYARLEKFMGSGWVKLHEIGINGTPAEHVSYAQKLESVDVELFRRTADILWDVKELLHQ